MERHEHHEVGHMGRLEHPAFKVEDDQLRGALFALQRKYSSNGPLHIGHNGKQVVAGADRAGHIYGGTVPYAEVERRRARNRTARKSRRINRRAA